MNVCIPLLPAGINPSCLQDLKEIKNVIITSTAAQFTSPNDAITLSSWKTKLQTDLSVYVPLGVNEFDVTTEKPPITTMQSTRKVLTADPIPSAVFYVAGNFCDFKELQASLRGGLYRMFFVDINGNVYGTKTGAGIVRGFAVNLTAQSDGLPQKEVAKNFQIFANFQYKEEFRDAILLTPNWNITMELTEAEPVGLSLYATSAITAGSINVRVTKRCADNYTGLLAADWEVVDSSELTTPGIATCTDNANGNYTLTLKKATSTPLASGDMIVIRVNKKTASITNYISNTLTINALA